MGNSKPLNYRLPLSQPAATAATAPVRPFRTACDIAGLDGKLALHGRYAKFPVRPAGDGGVASDWDSECNTDWPLRESDAETDARVWAMLAWLWQAESAQTVVLQTHSEIQNAMARVLWHRGDVW